MKTGPISKNKLFRARALDSVLRRPLFPVLIGFAILGFVFNITSQAAVPVTDASDTIFTPLPIGAGGWVTGMAASNDGVTRLIRTDTYGGYYWDTVKNKWIMNVNSISMPSEDVKIGHEMGVVAIAVAPNDSTKAFMANSSSVYKSTDSARSWTKVLRDVPGHSNDYFRMWGERLMVDPANANTVYYGSQLNGLWVSADGGSTWNQNTSLPAGITTNTSVSNANRGCLRNPTATVNGVPLASAGINAVVFDAGKGLVGGRTGTLYAASHGRGVWRSSDGGTSWSKISNDSQFTSAMRMTVAANGDVFATAYASTTEVCGDKPSMVWRYRSGVWANVTPSNSSWSSLASDPSVPGRIIVIAQGGRLAHSADYGGSWTVMGDQWHTITRTTSSSGDIPWLAGTLGSTEWMSLGGIMFDPVKPGRLWITEGIGVWYHDVRQLNDYSATRPVDWHSQGRGIEQLVATDVIHAPGGKPNMSSWDRPLFRSESLDSFPLKYGPDNKFSSAWSLDYSLSNSQFLVSSVASHQWPGDTRQSGYSTDGGQTWTRFGSVPLNSSNAYDSWGFGQIAVSSPDNMVWVPSHGKRPHFTKDRGNTWQAVTLPGVSDYSKFNDRAYYVKRKIITADKITPGVFYMYGRDLGVFKTVDGGTNWTRVNSTNITSADMAWNVTMKAVPTKAGHLFITPGSLDGITNQPLMRSSDGGASWSTVAGISNVHTFGFGKSAPGTNYPAIYIAGAVNGVFGFYRSSDNASSWTKLADYPLGSLDSYAAVDGDKDVYGKVYIGFGGSGWAYGQLQTSSSDTTAPDVAITSPSAGSTASGTISATVNASDAVGVTKVEIFVDGVLKGSDSNAPYSIAMDTTSLTNGMRNLQARAYDAAGNIGYSPTIQLNVSNPTVVQLPDMIVTDIMMSPNVPKSGDRVVFSAVVKNQGIAPTLSGITTGVNFIVNGAPVHWGTHDGQIAPGQSVTIVAKDTHGDTGINYWTAQEGTHTIEIHVDDINRYQESDESNNKLIKDFIVNSISSGNGDANGDGRVNAIDLSILISKDGQNYAPADFNGDGKVGAADMAIVLSKWTW